MTEPEAKASLRREARIGGILYLLIILGGLFAEMGVRDRLVVSGDAAATARNILAHEGLYRSGFAVTVLYLFCAVFLLFILYDLLRVVSARLAWVAVFVNLVSIAIESVSLLGHFAPLVLLDGSRGSSGLAPEQLQSLAYLSLRLQSAGFNVSLAFFGVFCVVAGILIYRSTFLPRAIGALMALAGVCYFVNSFAWFLAPPLAARLFPWILMPCLLGEASLCLWLLFAGVNVSRWEEQAARAGTT